MKNLMDQDAPLSPSSPDYFLKCLQAQPQHPHPIESFSLQQLKAPPLPTTISTNYTPQPLPPILHKKHTTISQKSQKKRLAGMRRRLKNKEYVGSLEQSVDGLERELGQYSRQLVKCKVELAEALRANKNGSSEHDHIFVQMEGLVCSQDPDIDRLNLLIDVILSRIGVSGQERQSKLMYLFRQIINSMFPALHRYLMIASQQGIDCFGQENKQYQSWTQEMYNTISLTIQQRERLKELQSKGYSRIRNQASRLIHQLRQVQTKLKSQQSFSQKTIVQLRQTLDPIQTARLIIFSQKNKHRRQFSQISDCLDFQGNARKRHKKQQHIQDFQSFLGEISR